MYIIYLEDSVLLSKKKYTDWREIQDEYYEKFKTSLGPIQESESRPFLWARQLLFHQVTLENEHSFDVSGFGAVSVNTIASQE